jgi:hypothetical protein
MLGLISMRSAMAQACIDCTNIHSAAPKKRTDRVTLLQDIDAHDNAAPAGGLNPRNGAETHSTQRIGLAT